MFVDISYPKPKEHRKAKIKVVNRDLWSGDGTLALIILAVLKKFKKMKRNGYPGSFEGRMIAMAMEDSPEKEKLLEYYDNETEEQYQIRETKEVAEWEECLDKMIYTFDHIAYDREFPWEIEMHKETERAIKAAKFKSSDSWFSDEAKAIRDPIYTKYMFAESYKESELKVQEGLDLFAKHFRSLWD